MRVGQKRGAEIGGAGSVGLLNDEAAPRVVPLNGHREGEAEQQAVDEIQAEPWKHATAAAKEAPNDITATFIESLNETIDTDAERIAAMRAGIPGGVWLLLVMVAVFGCATTSYAAGAEGARSKLGSLFLPLLITVVIVLIFDISHPRVGMIQVGQQALEDLQHSTQTNQPIDR